MLGDIILFFVCLYFLQVSFMIVVVTDMNKTKKWKTYAIILLIIGLIVLDLLLFSLIFIL